MTFGVKQTLEQYKTRQTETETNICVLRELDYIKLLRNRVKQIVFSPSPVDNQVTLQCSEQETNLTDVNVHVYSPDIPCEFSGPYNLHPWY